MKLNNFGIDPETKIHKKILTETESCFLGIMWTECNGRENAISANELAVRFDFALRDVMPGRKKIAATIARVKDLPEFQKQKRMVRYIQNHLITMHDNIPVFSTAGKGGGYWIADNKDDATDFYNAFRKRGMTGLVKASRGKKAAFVDMMQQLSFEFEDRAADIGILNASDISPGDSAAIAVVDSFLSRMTKNPEKFSAGLKRLSKKYGSILLDKTEVAAMKAKASELSKLVEALG